MPWQCKSLLLHISKYPHFICVNHAVYWDYGMRDWLQHSAQTQHVCLNHFPPAWCSCINMSMKRTWVINPEWAFMSMWLIGFMQILLQNAALMLLQQLFLWQPLLPANCYLSAFPSFPLPAWNDNHIFLASYLLPFNPFCMLKLWSPLWVVPSANWALFL